MTGACGTALPQHGRVDCTACFGGAVTFNGTRREQDGWRITSNPLSWGNERPKVLVLGFSKGPLQSGAVGMAEHDEIAFRGAANWQNAYNILARVGVVPPSDRPAGAMCQLIADRNGSFGFGSLVRCSVERRAAKGDAWEASGGGMLDRFASTSLGREVVGRCATRFLADLPEETRLVIMFGMGTDLNYVDACERAIRAARRRPTWRKHDKVSYGDDAVLFVHVEHFASQGRYVRDWLGRMGDDGQPKDPYRNRLASMSAAAVQRATASTN